MSRGAALALLVAVAVGCGGEDSTGGSAGPTATRADATTVAEPTTAAEPATTTTTVPAGPADQAGPVDQAPPVATNGIVATADRLYVCNLTGGEIVAADPASGRITARWDAADGVEGPDDLALGSDGALYFTSYTTGVVGRIDPDGAVGEIARLAPGVNPIAFAPDGRLFVGLAVTADGLWEVDPAGQDEPRLVAEALGNVNAFAFGEDGLVYGPRFGLAGAGALVTVDPDTGAVAEVATGLDYPVAVRFTADGTLLVAQEGEAALLRFDPEARSFEPFATVGHAIDNFAVAPDGRLYVTSFNQAIVSVVTPEGEVSQLTLGSAA